MKSRIAAVLALVAAIVVGLVVLRPKRDRTVPVVAPPVVSSPTTSRTATPRPSIRLAMPAPAVAPVTVPEACASGTSGAADWWTCLPATPAWDATRASYLRDRLAKYLDFPIAADRIECRTRCCRVRLTKDEYHAKLDELQSAVGLRIGPTDGLVGIESHDVPGMFEVRTCWRDGNIDDYPDRAAERDALLAAIQPDLAACGHGLDAPLTLDLMLSLTDDATLDDIKLLGDAPAPDAVRDCVEALLRRGAAFEPAPDTMTLTIPMHVRIAP